MAIFSKADNDSPSAKKTIHGAWLKGTNKEDLGHFKLDTLIESQTCAPVLDAANSHHNYRSRGWNIAL